MQSQPPTPFKRLQQELAIMDTEQPSSSRKRQAPLTSMPSLESAPSTNQSGFGEDEDAICFTHSNPKKANLQHFQHPPTTTVSTVSRPEMETFIDALKTLKDSDFLDFNPEPLPHMDWTSRHIGALLTVNKALKGQEETIYIQKNNGSFKPSVLHFPFSELEEFLCATLIPLYKRLKSSPPFRLFRPNTVHHTKNEAFWRDDDLVVQSPSGTIKLKPFLQGRKGETVLAIKFWMPLPAVQLPTETGVYITWEGPSIVVSPNNLLGIISILGSYIADITATNRQVEDGPKPKKK